MSFEFKYRSDRRRARNSSEEDERHHSPEHNKDKHRQDKTRKSKWERKSRSRSRSNHRQDKYASHEHGSYKREQKYGSRQMQYRSKDYDKRQSRYHEEERWRETEKKQKNRNEQGRKRYDEDNKKNYQRPRKDQNQRLSQRKEQPPEKKENNFSERKRQRSPSSHSRSSSKKDAKVDKQPKDAQREDKRQFTALKREENYKQNKDDKDDASKLRYIRKKDDNEPGKKQILVGPKSPLKQDVKKLQNASEREKGDQRNKGVMKNELQENKNDQITKDKASNPAIVSGLKFGVKCIFPPPPPKQKKPDEQFKKQPEKHLKSKQNEDRIQPPSKQSKIDKEIAELSPFKRHIEERPLYQTKPDSRNAEPKLQKLKISKYQLMLSEAKNNLEVPPPSSSFLILDTFKSMNKFYVETLDARWANLLRHDLEQYDNFKEKTMSKLQLEGDEGTESKQWVWLKEERNEQQLDLKFKLQELRQQSMSVNELVRRLRFID